MLTLYLKSDFFKNLKLNDVILPYAAPSTGVFGGISPLGAMQGCIALTEGQGWPFWQPPSKARSAGLKRHPGRLFFGYFLLAKQKKVSRPRVREPDSKAVALATPQFQNKLTLSTY